jgi:hypothetical protein
MTELIRNEIRFPAIARKKITAAFDGGRLTSDGGVLLLSQAERKMEICRQLAACIADPRDPSCVIHRLEDILRARVLAIACGYEDADDLDALRDDPGFRLALGKLPASGAGLASQPTMSRWENAPTTRELARMMVAMVGIYCASYPKAPKAVTLDIDDTCDVVHAPHSSEVRPGRLQSPPYLHAEIGRLRWKLMQKREPRVGFSQAHDAYVSYTLIFGNGYTNDTSPCAEPASIRTAGFLRRTGHCARGGIFAQRKRAASLRGN